VVATGWPFGAAPGVVEVAGVPEAGVEALPSVVADGFDVVAGVPDAVDVPCFFFDPCVAVVVAAGAGVVAGTMELFPFAFLLFGVAGVLEELVDGDVVVAFDIAAPVGEVPVVAVLLLCFR
jgi:hypothetical protein